jgi:hypothetical protein
MEIGDIHDLNNGNRDAVYDLQPLSNVRMTLRRPTKIDKFIEQLVSTWTLENSSEIDTDRAIKIVIRKMFPKLAYYLDEIALELARRENG